MLAGLNKVFVGRAAFTKLRHIEGVAKTYNYPQEMIYMDKEIGGAPYVLVKSDAHRGKGIKLLSRLQPESSRGAANGSSGTFKSPKKQNDLEQSWFNF